MGQVSVGVVTSLNLMPGAMMRNGNERVGRMKGQEKLCGPV
jgi:hypothetical protein